jgi:hypothetical protein
VISLKSAGARKGSGKRFMCLVAVIEKSLILSIADSVLSDQAIVCY